MLMFVLLCTVVGTNTGVVLSLILVFAVVFFSIELDIPAVFVPVPVPVVRRSVGICSDDVVWGDRT